MDSAIDEALSRFVRLKRSVLASMLDDDGLTVAELAAVKIILEALDEGGPAMRLLVERTGGKAVQKQLSITAKAGADAASRLAALLGGGSGSASKGERLLTSKSDESL